MTAGIFYCPYVPLQMVRAVGQDTFQPKIDSKLDTPTAKPICWQILNW